MTTPTALSAARRRAASGSLMAGAAVWGAWTLWLGGWGRDALPWSLWNLTVAATLAAASTGLARRSVIPQVLARGALVWVVAGAAMSPWLGSPWLAMQVGLVALSITALRLSAPGLHTEAAHAEFAPVAYRRVFLVGAIGAAAVGLSSVFGGLWQALAVMQGHPSGVSGEVWGPALLAVPSLASVVGVLRMRAWGVIVGAATAVGTVVCALPVLHEVSLLGVAFVCIPGALLAAPLVASRLLKPSRSPRLRVAGVDGLDVVTVDQDSIEGDAELDGSGVAHAASVHRRSL